MITNPNFWDCECETRYIHSKKYYGCSFCFSTSEEGPDSIEEELIEINMAIDKSLSKTEYKELVGE